MAALLSARGGSSYILTQLTDRARFQINEFVLAELRDVLEVKFSDNRDILARAFLLLGVARVETVANPNRAAVRTASRVISKSDAPILASAMSPSEYLITLDKEFLKPSVLATARRAGLMIVRPGDFIALFR